MAQSVRIKSIYLKNFIGINIGLGKKELEVNFDKLKDKNLILILGDNAGGKTTFMSVLHPLPGTTDGRSKFIIDDKEGIKKLVIDRSDGCRFECKIVYSPTKTGHNAHGYIYKTDKDGNEFNLNENGNISSYKEIVAEELGCTEPMLKLANQNDAVKGIVDLTATERKLNMNSFLPDDIYSDFYTIADKIYKDLKSRVNVLVESLGKLHNEDTLKLELQKIEKEINELVEKRDRCTGKISELRTRIQVIQESGIEDEDKKLRKDIKESYSSIENVKSTISNIYSESSLGSFLALESTTDRIKAVIKSTADIAKEKEISYQLATAKLQELKSQRNRITEQIETKKNSIKDIESEHTLDELKEIKKEYEKQADELTKTSSIIPTGVTKETYMTGYEIIKNIREYIDGFGYYDRDLVEAICNNEMRDYKPDELLKRRSELTSELSDINAKINSISDDESEDILSKRPPECKIDNCAFIATACKLKKIHDKLPEYTKRISAITIELNSINNKLDKDSQIKEIKSKIDILMQYINTNISVISKLPKSDKYSTIEGVKKAILKGRPYLSDCDDFESYIEAIEEAEELVKLVTIKIPEVSHSIELLETKGKFLDSTKDELAILEQQKNNIMNDIQEYNDTVDSLNESIEYYKGIINALESFCDKKEEFQTLYDQIVSDDNRLKEIKSKIDEIADYKERLEEKKEKLDDIDEKLKPLTQNRDLYRMEQLKIADFKDELAIVNDDMFKCEIVRAALSIKDDGIPVSALEWFLDTVRQTANALLSKAFNGNLYLDDFVITSRDFDMPYRKKSVLCPDVCYASSSERTFISICITMAIIEETVSKYNICCLDELDRGMSELSRSVFIQILTNSISRAGISQLFMITHNAASYRSYSNAVGYIIFPGGEISSEEEKYAIHILKEDEE